MPRVKIDYVVSFSSEDPDHPAANLLQEAASGRRWLAAGGTGTASVVLQLARAVRISSLSLGAHRSALVEVLVGRSETPQYEVLVPRCVLQTPTEARRGTNPDRVRSFSAEQMAEAARDKSWDRVRVVCSQPYDKHCKFGLSFVHIFEPEDALPTARPQQLTLESWRRDSSEDESFRPGALFAAHLQTSGSPAPQTSGNQIRQATSRALKNITDTSAQLIKTPLSTEKTRHGDRDRPGASKTDDKPHKIREKEKCHKEIIVESRNERNSNFDNSVASHKGTEKDKKTTVDKKSEQRPSFDSKESRHREKDKQIRQRETKESSKNDRDFESRRKEESGASKERRNREDDKRGRDRRTPNKGKKDSRKRTYEETSRQDEQRTLQVEECDTDDEIEKFLRKQKRKEHQAKTSPNHTEPPSEDVTRVDNRAESSNQGQENTRSTTSGVLPAFLDGLTFAIDSGVSKIGFDEQLIRRYVLAYGGEIVEEAESANYLLCGAAPEHPASAPLRADWVWRCHQRGRRARLQPYLLT